MKKEVLKTYIIKVFKALNAKVHFNVELPNQKVELI
jgi:hypothetical protein